jgi:hypothetical protein
MPDRQPETHVTMPVDKASRARTHAPDTSWQVLQDPEPGQSHEGAPGSTRTGRGVSEVGEAQSGELLTAHEPQR